MSTGAGARKPYRPSVGGDEKYQVVSVKARPRDEEKFLERIDVSRCHPAEKDKVMKIAKAYMEFGGYQSELKATATDGNGHTILSIMPWAGEFSAPVLAQTFHRKNNKSINLEYESIIDTRIVPLSGEVRVIIQKTAQTALADDRKAQRSPAVPLPPNALYRASSKRYHEEEQEDYEEEEQAPEEDEGHDKYEVDGPVDYAYYTKPRPYIPRKR